jgi:pimeloyl-ACP methyl ester carboxylesterase
MAVELVRRLVSSTDDAAAGVVGLPWPASFVLGEEGLGLHGVGTSAAGIMAAAGSLGYLRETPVTVRRFPAPGMNVPLVLPPAGFGDLANRIPQISPGGPQLLIERYGAPGQAEWVVYIGGTVSWNPEATAEPWDLTSNLAAVADSGSPNSGSGSYRAVVQAMEQAGIGADDPVIMVGHSQGGLVAAQVAASGTFSTAAIATFGAPTAQLDLPPGIPVVFVEHSDDLVPALGGMPHLGPAAGAAVGAAAAVRLTVRREVYATAPVPVGQALPAHNLAAYRDTGVLMDESPEPRLGRFQERLTRLVGTQPGTSSRWRGTRVPTP